MHAELIEYFTDDGKDCVNMNKERHLEISYGWPLVISCRDVEAANQYKRYPQKTKSRSYKKQKGDRIVFNSDRATANVVSSDFKFS